MTAPPAAPSTSFWNTSAKSRNLPPHTHPTTDTPDPPNTRRGPPWRGPSGPPLNSTMLMTAERGCRGAPGFDAVVLDGVGDAGKGLDHLQGERHGFAHEAADVQDPAGPGLRARIGEGG